MSIHRYSVAAASIERVGSQQAGLQTPHTPLSISSIDAESVAKKLENRTEKPENRIKK
jgi:hypothetical protein